MVSRFQILQTLGHIISVNFSVNSIVHMLRIITTMLAKNSILHALDNPPNYKVNFGAISNVITFLTLRFNVQTVTVYSFKRPYEPWHEISNNVAF